MTTTLTVAAVCIHDARGRLLTVRKRGTSRFMLPGGKLEPGETPAEAAVREIAEEVGISLNHRELGLLGEWHVQAANEPDTMIESTVYTAEVDRPVPRIAGEIDELRWLDVAAGDEHDDLAPMLVLHVLPTLRAA